MISLPASLLNHDRIALIGTAPSGKKSIPTIPADVPIFTIAAAYKLKEMTRPMTACLEIHPVWTLRDRNYSPTMWAWLQEPHDFPIFTLTASPEIPASIPYPLDDIVAELLPGLTRGPDDEQIRFFTSSFDYLMALAICCNPRRIDIHGYDMGSDTEYRYQREGGVFWMGLARGRGIAVNVSEEAPILDSLLYSYEGTQMITHSRVLEIEKSVKNKLRRTRAAYYKRMPLVPALPVGDSPSDEDQEKHNEVGRLRDMYHLLGGALSALKQLKADYSIGDLKAEDHEPILTRQIIELQRHAIQVGQAMNLSRLNWKEGAMYDRRDRYQNNREHEGFAPVFLKELQLAIEDYARVRDEYFTYNGGTQLCNHLIAECDLQTDKMFEPALTFVMLNPDTSTVIGGPGAELMATPEKA